MKNINNKQKNIDPIAEARSGKYFKQYSKEAKERIKLGIEIYRVREALGISQQELAKQAKTTQKVVSRIENGDVNLGLALLNRMASVLNFNCENWSNILGFSVPAVRVIFASAKTENNQESKTEIFSSTTSSVFVY